MKKRNASQETWDGDGGSDDGGRGGEQSNDLGGHICGEVVHNTAVDGDLHGRDARSTQQGGGVGHGDGGQIDRKGARPESGVDAVDVKVARLRGEDVDCDRPRDGIDRGHDDAVGWDVGELR